MSTARKQSDSTTENSGKPSTEALNRALYRDSMISWIQTLGSKQLQAALLAAKNPFNVIDDFRDEYLATEYPAWNHRSWELCDSPEKFQWSREELPSVLAEGWAEFKRRHAWRHASFVSFGDEYFALVRDPLLHCPVRCPFGSSRSDLEDIVTPDAADILMPDTIENPESKDGSSEDTGVTRIASVEEQLAPLSAEVLNLGDLWRLTRNDDDGEASEDEIEEILHTHERTAEYVEVEREIRLKPKKAWAIQHGSARLKMIAESGMLKDSEAAFRDEYILREYPGWEYNPGEKYDKPRNPPIEVLQEWAIAKKLVPSAVLRYMPRKKAYCATAKDAMFRIPIRVRIGTPPPPPPPPSALVPKPKEEWQSGGVGRPVYRILDADGDELLRVDSVTMVQGDKDSTRPVVKFGFSRKKIHFEIVIASDGSFSGFDDLRRLEDHNKREIPTTLLVPCIQTPDTGQHVLPHTFCWDNTGSALGRDKGQPELAEAMFNDFRDLHLSMRDEIEDDGYKALCKFLSSWTPMEAESLPNWEEMAGLNVVFRLKNHPDLIHESRAVKEAWEHIGERQVREFFLRNEAIAVLDDGKLRFTEVVPTHIRSIVVGLCGALEANDTEKRSSKRKVSAPSF